MALWSLITGLAAVGLALFAAPPASAAESVFWGNDGTGAIDFANLDNSGAGGTLTTSGAPTPSDPQGVAVDPASGKVYWANTGPGTIAFANLDGSGGGTMNTAGGTVSTPVGVAVDPANGKIYWANDVGDTIGFANLDDSGGGGTLSTAGATISFPWGLAVDPANGKIYWANNDNPPHNKISFANLDGSGGGDLNTSGTTVNNAEGVAVDPANGRVYWANPSGTIAFANLDDSGGGGTLSTSPVTPDQPNGVAVDPANGKIYWANEQGASISFANLDGSGGGGNLNTLPLTPNHPEFPVVLEQPSGAGVPIIIGATVTGSVLSCSQGTWSPDLLAAFDYMAPQSFAYAWSENGAPLTGATSSTLTASTPGSYACTVTATNHAGSSSQTSAAHLITVPVTKPHISGATLGSKSFKAKKGTTIKLTLSTRASVKVVITHLISGHKVKGVCKAHAIKGKKCTIKKKVTTLHFSGVAGANRFKLLIKSLKPGSYTMKITASNSAGTSNAVTRKFKIIKVKTKK